MSDRPAGMQISNPLLHRVLRHRSMSMLFRTASPLTAHPSVSGRMSAEPSRYVMATRAAAEPIGEIMQSEPDSPRPILLPSPLITETTGATSSGADEFQAAQESPTGKTSATGLRSALSRFIQPITERLRPSAAPAPTVGRETASELSSAISSIASPHLPDAAAHTETRPYGDANRADNQNVAQQQAEGQHPASASLQAVLDARSQKSVRQESALLPVTPVTPQVPPYPSGDNLPHTASEQVESDDSTSAGSAEEGEYRPDWKRLSAITLAHERKAAVPGLTAPGASPTAAVTNVQRGLADKASDMQSTDSAIAGDSESKAFRGSQTSDPAGPSPANLGTALLTNQSITENVSDRPIDDAGMAQGLQVEASTENARISRQHSAPARAERSPFAESHSDEEAETVVSESLAAIEGKAPSNADTIPEIAVQAEPSTQPQATSATRLSASVQRQADMDVAAMLQRVNPSRPTESTVHVIAPRRPRPSRPAQQQRTRSEQGNDGAGFQRREDGTASLPIQPTGIGDLPVDLWTLIDEEPPRAAAHDFVRPSSVPDMGESDTVSRPLSSTDPIVQARYADSGLDPEGRATPPLMHDPSAVTPVASTVEPTETASIVPETNQITPQYMPTSLPASVTSPRPSSSPTRTAQSVVQSQPVDVAMAVMRAAESPVGQSSVSVSEHSVVMDEVPLDEQAVSDEAINDEAVEEPNIEELARQVYTRLRRRLAVERERLG